MEKSQEKEIMTCLKDFTSLQRTCICPTLWLLPTSCWASLYVSHPYISHFDLQLTLIFHRVTELSPNVLIRVHPLYLVSEDNFLPRRPHILHFLIHSPGRSSWMNTA